MSRFISVVVLCTFLGISIGAEPAEKSNLDGTWVFDSVKPEKGDNLNRVWSSIVVVDGDSFTISSIMRNPAPLRGKVGFDKANPTHVDFATEELDFSYFGAPHKWSAGKRKGLYEFVDDNRVRLAFPISSDGPRPTDFKAAPEIFVAELCRAPKGFKEFPKEITVNVSNADGKPVEGAIVSDHFFEGLDIKKKAGLQYRNSKKTDAQGTAKVAIEEPPFVIRDEASKEMAMPRITPATLAGGSIKAVLAPECRLVSSVKCDELAKAGQSLGSSMTLLYSNGMRIGSVRNVEGKIEMLVSPGTYTLNTYGENLHDRRVEVTVPAGQSTFEMKPIELKASALATLKGKPAPEFVNVMGWTGKPVKLADLKGQYVLVDFWGYWCGPCVHAMPVLIELHEKFHDKGLAVVGIHQDIDGDVDTVAKFDEMNATHVKDVWKGKKLPFTNALVSGKREGEDHKTGGTPKLYGIMGYPTTVLIDREGKVVGQFHARDIKSATAEVEKLLAAKKE